MIEGPIEPKEGRLLIVSCCSRGYPSIPGVHGGTLQDLGCSAESTKTSFIATAPPKGQAWRKQKSRNPEVCNSPPPDRVTTGKLAEVFQTSASGRAFPTHVHSWSNGRFPRVKLGFHRRARCWRDGRIVSGQSQCPESTDKRVRKITDALSSATPNNRSCIQ
jgi:hypothetical protein